MALKDGDSSDNNLSGTVGSDRLYGREGNDSLYGRSGDDLLVGGAGADRLEGGLGADRLSGGSGSDDLNGFDGDDIIADGPGSDVIDGGFGDDLYLAGPGADLYDIVDNYGNDTVSYRTSDAGVAITLSSTTASGAGGYAEGDLAFVENVVGSPYADDLRWNRDISPSGVTNRFDGGAGADRMEAGRADDTYVVDNPGDVVNENAGEGNDTIESSISYTLPNHVETLQLTGSGDINATGDGDGDTLIGNSGANRLAGRGGSDTLRGGEGDDTYINPAGDTVDEAGGHGDDTVESDATYTLPAYVENLVLTGTGDTDGTGNALDNRLTGNSGANVLDGAAGADDLRGRSGDDTYVVDESGDRVTERAGEGSDTVESAVDWSLGDHVENLTLTGTGNIDATGNALDNALTGNAGANVLDGRGGADTMAGGQGDDTYIVDATGDTVSEAPGAGTDTVRSWISRASLASDVENLTLTGTGDTDATGNALDNTLTGTAGSNRLDGMGGRDRLIGRDGDDAYVINTLFDSVVEQPGAGFDTVESAVSYDLDPYVESARLTAAAGGARLTGNAQRNELTGNGGDNELDGGGGLNELAGGAGDDAYYVQNADTTVDEASGNGTDRVYSTVSYTLPQHVEELRLNGAADLEATGNALDNTLGGNRAANRLDGLGGADTLRGFEGDDVYVVDDPGDTVSEIAGGGEDRVESSLDWTLGDHVENLILAGTGDTDGTGNALDNRLTGNSGANVLDGGAGADALTGGRGDDTYVVDDPGDTVREAAGEGTDTVESAVDFTLGTALENLTLTGAANTSAVGNGRANTLTGNAGDNVLSGRGGADILRGGGGDDRYLIQDSGDSVIEKADDGYDTVCSTIAEVDLASGVERLILNAPASSVGNGNDLANTLLGPDVASTLTGGGGDDLLRGNAGDDLLAGNVGDDQLLGDGGQDALAGLLGDDLLLGGAGQDALRGNAGDDRLLGGERADSLAGGTGDDLITGDDGADILNGGLGRDRQYGGDGGDRFVFDKFGDTKADPEHRDTLFDFDSSEGDVIDVSGMDAVIASVGDDAFDFLSGFTGNAGQAVISQTGFNQYLVQFDVNGTGEANAEIDVTTPSLDPGDFIA
jgi:Ca2+-binding RTX toxin-like protein